MIEPRLISPLLPVLVLVSTVGWGWTAYPDWFGLLRTLMMVLGGLVVVAIILIVAVAIISGVLGMVGRLRKKS